MAFNFIQFLLLISTLPLTISSSKPDKFIFNGFNNNGTTNKLKLDGEAAQIQPNGLLRLTDSTPLQMGHAFFPTPLSFPNSSSLSFSTTFIFAMLPQSPNLGGHGLAFFLSPTVDFTQAVASQHLGLFNATTNGVSRNHVLAIEFDAMRSPEFQDIDNNHVGVDVNSLISIDSAPASFVNPDGLVWGSVAYWKRRKLYAEVCEEWEKEYNPQRFSYKNLYLATRGFKEKHFLGVGGFGKVYKGVLPKSGMEIAVKRVNHDSRQGMKEFVAEIVSIGRLRHRNLVQLLGYCRRKGELLLVYDYMPNGSLDKVLFSSEENPTTLDWPQRQRIIRGVASALLYLHEEWEQVVIHRDIKASNVLLDADLNGRLGDFGLARLHDHGTNSHTTQVAGTVGYLAPELTRLGKATTSTDVFAFGVFMLEVACGRRPVDVEAEAEEVVLVDWVVKCWQGGDILSAVDPRLQGSYEREEMELVMRLGLLCSHTVATLRPSMRKVMQYLDGDTTLPEISLESTGVGNFPCYSERSDLYLSNFTASRASMNSFCSQDSIITTGR
ncbi:L-type lectin-domain containing receptor kinase SIT2 [Linum perenne]